MARVLAPLSGNRLYQGIAALGWGLYFLGHIPLLAAAVVEDTNSNREAFARLVVAVCVMICELLLGIFLISEVTKLLVPYIPSEAFFFLALFLIGGCLFLLRSGNWITEEGDEWYAEGSSAVALMCAIVIGLGILTGIYYPRI